MSLLDTFLKKNKLKYEDLTRAERDVFKKWKEDLSGKPITIPILKDFLKEQRDLALTQFEDYENPTTKDLYLKVYSRICRQILDLIDVPEEVKKAREKSIETKINEK